MRVLLLAMPDTVSALDAIIRVPNLGLCSIAGNLPGVEVKVLDLAFKRTGLTRFLADVLQDYRPNVIGLSAMSFQYASACRVAGICRRILPDARVALGGYHATLMFEEIAAGPDAPLFDFLIRGEGENTFRTLIERLDAGGPLDDIPGLSRISAEGSFHSPSAPLLDLKSIALPNRDCRVLDTASFMGSPFDCVETSRGCTMDCHFCSITQMYGKCIRKFSLDRVVLDLQALKARGKKGVFFVDDNITLDIARFKELCRLISANGLQSMSYVIQASVPGIASDAEFPKEMRKAGFKWVFLGIENGIKRNLDSMGKRGVLENARAAVSSLRREGIGVFGGFIIANPDDTAEDIRSTFKFALELGVDQPIMQCLTPYPKTRTRVDLLKRGLVTNADDYSRYNGFTVNVRTAKLPTTRLNQLILINGLRLYFDPLYLARSRFWRVRPRYWPALVENNFRYLEGALKSNIFASRHTW